MFDSKNIEGIDILKRKIPKELQYWHEFGRISELHYRHIFDAESCAYIPCIELFLTDMQNRYTIKMFLFHVHGLVSFDICNGFFSGLTIDDFSDRGYEKERRFHLSSFEQDIEFTIECEKIKVELVHENPDSHQNDENIKGVI